LTDFAARSSRAGALLWLLPAAVAIVIRLLSVSTLVGRGRIHFFDPDSSYHFRRVWAALNSNGIVPLYDPALAYPHGAEPIWSPFYDQTLVLLSWGPWLIGDRFGVELTLAVVPLLIVLALIRLFWNHTAPRWGRGPALVASLVLAVLPALGMYSRFGNADHHALEVLVAFAFFLTVNRAVGGTRTIARPTITRQVLCGLLIGLTVAYWVGLVVFLGAWGFWLVGMALRRAIDVSRCRSFGVSMLIAAAFLALNFVIWGNRDVDPRLAFLSLTWSQAVMVAAAAFGTFLFAARTVAIRVASGLAASACAVVAIRPMIGGSSFLSKNDTWLSIIAEFRSPFAVRDSSWAAYADPLWLLTAATVLAFVAWHHRRDVAARLWPWLFSAQALAMAAVQQRFVPFAVLAEALICAELLAGLTRRGARWGVGGVVLVAAMFHAWQLDWRDSAGQMTVDNSLVEVLDWVRVNSTPMSDPLMLQGKPEYGVLARWCVGPYILRYAERPAVLTSHGNQVPGFAEGHEPLLAESQGEAIELCRKLGIRYILIIDSRDHIASWARHAGRPPSDYVSVVRHGNDAVLVPSARYFRTLAGRLMVFQGLPARVNMDHLQQGTVVLEAWPRFRRVARSTQDRKIPFMNIVVPKVQLFEVDLNPQ